MVASRTGPLLQSEPSSAAPLIAAQLFSRAEACAAQPG